MPGNNNNLWTVGQVLQWTTNRFKQADIETARLDSQLLLSKVLGVSKIQLYIDTDRPLSSNERALLRDFVKRRLQGEPVAYILNEKHWHNLILYVDNRVLIPRPETETLLDFVLETANFYDENNTFQLNSCLSENKESPTNTNRKKIIFDFCTGSGCLAISLGKEFPNAVVVGIDIANEALTIARKNAESNKVTNIEWLNLDLTSMNSFELLKKKYGQADIIVANPPYVTEKEWEQCNISVKNYEPKLALTAADDGLFIGKKIFDCVRDFNLLNKNKAIFAMEMAESQPQKISNLELKNYSCLSRTEERMINSWFSLKDLEGKSRFLCRINNCR